MTDSTINHPTDLFPSLIQVLSTAALPPSVTHLVIGGETNRPGERSYSSHSGEEILAVFYTQGIINLDTNAGNFL